MKGTSVLLRKDFRRQVAYRLGCSNALVYKTWRVAVLMNRRSYAFNLVLKRWVLLVAVCLPASSLVAAQSSSASQTNPSEQSARQDGSSPTRKEELRKEREERRKEVKPPPQDSFLQKFLKRFDQKGNQTVEDANFRGFHPRVDWIARGSGPALGVRYWKPGVVGPLDVMGSAFYSWRKYQLYDLQFGVIPHRGRRMPSRKFETEGLEELGDFRVERFSRFKLYANLRYRDRTDESFFGPGADSLKDNQSRYRVRDQLAEGVTGYQFTRRIGYTLRLGYLGNSLADPRSDPPVEARFALTELPGFLNTPDYFILRQTFLLDFRDHPGVPHQGLSFAFGWDRFDNTNASNQFNFNRFGADVRGYIPIRSRQQVIALRGFFVDSDPGEGDQVPFFLQPSLGGGESLRGYDPFRFQGDKLMLVQGEYRWEASRVIELALFGDTGTVANRGERLNLDSLKSDFGVGFRFKTSESTLFRLDVARGNEGTRLQFRFAPVF